MPDIFIEKNPSKQFTPSEEKLVVEKAGEAHAKHHMFPLAAFAVDPDGVHFATQGESEEIHLFMRRHFITNLPWMIFSVILLLLPLLSGFFIGGSISDTLHISANTFIILILFYYVVVFGLFILTSFINWYFNVYIVTNSRIVDVDFISILYREVSSTRLNLIQDVTVKTGGVLRAIFDYGDVFIQTAGTEVNFDFHAVPHPQEVAREIEKLMAKNRKKEGVSDLEEAIEK